MKQYDELYVNSGGERWVHHRPARVMGLLILLKVITKDVIYDLLRDKVINNHEARSWLYYINTGRTLGGDDGF